MKEKICNYLEDIGIKNKVVQLMENKSNQSNLIDFSPKVITELVDHKHIVKQSM